MPKEGISGQVKGSLKMSKPFALIIDSKVVNVALYDSLEHAQQDTADNTTVVEVLEGTRNPDIGSIWDGENFHPAPVVETVVTEEQPAITE